MTAPPWTDAQINAYALTHIALPALVLLVAVLLADRFVFTPKIREGEEARARCEAVQIARERAPFRRNISRGALPRPARRRRWR